MKHDVSQQAKEYAKEHKSRKRWYQMFIGLALIVVFGTIYALSMPATTMEKGQCDIPEHTHDDSCYKEETIVTKTPVCTKKNLNIHIHTKECYNEKQELICGYADFMVHEHDSTCYDGNGELWCFLPEIKAHTHNDSCYKEISDAKSQALLKKGYELNQFKLICKKQENDQHQHTEECYDLNQVLDCGQEEIILHKHTKECYDEEDNLICGKTEVLKHEHSEACFETKEETRKTDELICGKEEHTHDLTCYSDPDADVESKEDWEETIKDAELSGDKGEDAAAIAKTQVGYKESTKNYQVMSDGSTIKGYTRYGAWYGSPYEDWDAMFASFCLYYANVTEIPASADSADWINDLKADSCNRFEKAGEYEANVGDLIFFDTDEDGSADHVGILTEIITDSSAKEARYRVIEGDVDGEVRYETYYESDQSIAGYGRVSGKTEAKEEEKQEESSKQSRTKEKQGNLNIVYPDGTKIPDGYDVKYSYTDPDNRFGVTVYAPEDALPADVVLTAELLEKGSEEYARAEEALTDMKYDGLAAMDIHFMLDGKEVEPKSSVYVCINAIGLLPEEADEASLAVQHHQETGAATVETVADATEETGQVEALDNGTKTTADVAAAFEVESFSTFTITWGYTSNFVLNIHYLDTEGNDIAPSGIEKNFETVGNTANVTMSNYADMIDHPGYVYQYAYINNGGTKTDVNKLSYNTNNWYYTTKITTDPAEDDWTVWKDSAGKTPMDVYLVYQEINTDDTVKVTWQNGAYTLYLHYVDTNGNPLQIDTSKTYVNSVAGVGNIRVSDYAGLVYPPASYQYQNAYIEVNNAHTEVARISYNATLGHWCITTPEGDGNEQWLSWSGSETEVYNETQAHVYLSFEVKTDAYYYAQPIHDNIKLSLYDYGSYIDTGDDKVIPFYQAMGKYSSIDGLPANSLGSDSRPPAMEPTLNAAGYPQVSSGRSLEYLFRKGGLPLNTGSAADPLTKYADMRTNATWTADQGYRTQFESMRFDLGNDGGLFHVDEDGYYIYNCDEQSAYYNQDTNRFELSDTKIDVGHNGYAYKNFLPFDKIDPSLGGSFTENGIYKLPYSNTEDKRSGIADLWFGMTMQVDFYMPSSGKVNGKDMVFEFQGDDDVWVYIDDVLVLDIGGCHGARRGSINFATGNVVYPNPADDGATTINTTLKDLFTNANVSTASFGNSNTFIDWTEHTLKFYYMERGGNISSCHLKFNLPTRPDKALQVAKTLTADKEADADVVNHLGNTMEYKYRVVKADVTGNPTNQLLIKEGDSYIISGAGLTANETRTVGEGGYFTLKAGQMAEFSNMLARFDENDSVKKYVVQEVLPTGLTGQYQEVVYNIGSDTGTCTNDTTTVETDFTGYNSPAQNADTGNLVNYTNKVDTEKLSTLAITKKQVGGSLNGEPEYYYMKVQLGPDENSLARISQGTPYFVGTETRYVETAGIIKIAAGETAKVKLLAGTYYKVEEVADENGTSLTGNEGYTPTYSTNASGTVTQVDTTVNITVTNTFPTGDLALTKIVNNTAGGSTDGEFEFELKFKVEENWKATDYTAEYTTTNSGKTHTGETLSFAKQDGYAVATVKLYHNETVTVKGLPDRAEVSITETNSDGYSVGWKVNNNQESYGKTVTCSITKDSTASVTCTNTTGYELPDTGGTGTIPHTMGGLLLTTIAGLTLMYRYKKRRREA